MGGSHFKNVATLKRKKTRRKGGNTDCGLAIVSVFALTWSFLGTLKDDLTLGDGNSDLVQMYFPRRKCSIGLFSPFLLFK